MNKICGYSCEHNKSGVCQISICDKKTYMLDKTEIKHLSQSYYDLHEKYYKLQQENKKLNGVVQTYDILLKANVEENKRLKDNWNKLREYFNERIEVCDNRLSSQFCNFEKTTKERLIFSQCLEKLEELQGSDNNVKD